MPSHILNFKVLSLWISTHSPISHLHRPTDLFSVLLKSVKAYCHRLLKSRKYLFAQFYTYLLYFFFIFTLFYEKRRDRYNSRSRMKLFVFFILLFYRLLLHSFIFFSKWTDSILFYYLILSSAVIHRYIYFILFCFSHFSYKFFFL